MVGEIAGPIGGLSGRREGVHAPLGRAGVSACQKEPRVGIPTPLGAPLRFSHHMSALRRMVLSSPTGLAPSTVVASLEWGVWFAGRYSSLFSWSCLSPARRTRLGRSEVARPRPFEGWTYDEGLGVDLVALDGGRFALIDGLSRSPDAASHLSIVVGSEGTEGTVSFSPWKEGMIEPLGWWTGREVVVVGLRCRNADRSFLRKVEYDMVLGDACDSPASVAYAFDPDTEKWRLVTDDLYTAAFTYETPLFAVEAAAGPVAILSYRRSGLELALLKLDAESGTTVDLDGLPAQYSSDRVCTGPTGFSFVGTYDQDFMQPVKPLSDLRTDMFRLVGTTWEQVDIPPTERTGRFFPPVACMPTGGLITVPDDREPLVWPALREDRGGELHWTTLTAPTNEGTALGRVEMDSVDDVVIAQVFNKGQPTKLYRRAGRGWEYVGDYKHEPPRPTSISGPSAAYASMFTGPGKVVFVKPAR